MPNSLAKDLRNLLARVTLEARDAAEQAARSALENLAVHEKEYRPHMSTEQRQLRNRLRERGRGLGDVRDERTGKQDIRHLTEDVAYEHWHRLLFTRFLAANGLLHTDETHGNVPISLAECDELAPDLGARDGFELACRFASKTLPGVFRVDDPVFELNFAVNDQVALRLLLDSLPSEVFTADDALGWTYQFWQAKRKDEVNAAGKKVGADELPAVTQLFTEDYMVEFLLHNTLGAWWGHRRGAIHAKSESEARSKAALSVKDGVGITWTYLRFAKDEDTQTWRPAATVFDRWPRLAKDLRFLDPCMGSGHFLVSALPILVRLRMEDEKVSIKEAIYATLAANLYGLELDGRCAQIAAFNLALTAWKLGGYQPLPPFHLACSGMAPQTSEKQWVSLAGNNERLKQGMARLFGLFRDAPVVGSLIDPRMLAGNLIEAEFRELQPLLETVLAHEQRDEAAYETAVVARGVAKAADILASEFTLVATNVPYLGRGKQDRILQEYCERVYPEAKADIATCFLERCLRFCSDGGTSALVTPHSWLFLGTYKKMRVRLLSDTSLVSLARLGPGAFETIGGEVVNVALATSTRTLPKQEHVVFGVDATESKTPALKAQQLAAGEIQVIPQAALRANPDATITFSVIDSTKLLGRYGECFQGISPGDSARLCRTFSEMPALDKRWRPFQGPPSGTAVFSGRESVIDWSALEDGFSGAAIRGREAWGKRGVAIGQMTNLPAALYEGSLFSNSTPVIIPHASSTLPAIWAFCSGPDFAKAMRRLNPKLSVDNGYVSKVPFDLEYWRRVAATKYPKGLPKPASSDPAQWLFDGQLKSSDQMLHVAMARLLGYLWPRQTGSSFPDCPAVESDSLEALADEDGILCLTAINKERPAAHRLRTLLLKALGTFDERALLARTGRRGSRSSTLEEWVRDEFFEQHCDLFHQRPFVWHIWDGRRDGFHALINCHKLDHATLQKLTYSYVGDWIRQQEADTKADVPGADARLGAARELQSELVRILEGEAPYDIFVRWKPISKQPLGWRPDLNDGVRLNIRPFASANILRKRVKINWDKDRGKEPHRDKDEYPWFWCEAEPDTDPEPGRQFTGHRWNSVHLTIQRKRRARREK
jgi:hypothetical protein